MALGAQWLLCVAVGSNILAPWNALVSSSDLLRASLPEDEAPDIEFQVSAAFNGSELLCLALLLVAPRFGVKTSAVARTTLAFALYLALIPILSTVLEWGCGSTTLLLLAAVGGISTGLMQGSLFGLAAARGGPTCVQALSAGNALSGLLVVLLRFGARMGAVADSRASGTDFFTLVEATVLLAAAFFVLLCRSFGREDAAPGLSPLLPAEGAAEAQASPAQCSFVTAWPCMAAVCLNFVVTLSLFPGLVTSLLPFGVSLPASDFVLALVLTFQVGDFAGRMMAKGGLLGLRSPVLLLAAALGRLLLVPLLGARFFAPLCFAPAADTAAFALVALLSATNGYICARAMMTGPSLVKPQAREAAGIAMTLSLVSGLALGSVAGCGWPPPLRT